MSSSAGEVVDHPGKLLVHIAENGHSFELDCDETTPVEAVMLFIESVSGVSFIDQLALCLDVKLEPQRLLSAYKLPSNDREVFIFNKASMQSTSPPPPLEQVDILDIAEPPSTAHDPHPLDDASDPALKALPSYERQFRCHYYKGDTIYRCTQVKYEHCERFLREQKVQERAVEIARRNLDQYFQLINQHYADFMRRYTQQHRLHSDLLVNFGRDAERLRSTRLHPALQTTTRKCLLDFVKEENLQKSVENCTSSHRQFENKVSQFKQMFAEVKCKVDELFSNQGCLPIKNMELMIKEHQRYIHEQKSIMQSLSKDVNTVKKLVDDCLSGQLSSTLRPHDAVSALGPMYDVHDKNHLPRMQSFELAVSKLLEFCKDKKNEMNTYVHNYMQKITYISYVIKDAKLQFPVFKEAMARQDGLFVDLKLFHGIGPAYRSCISEVARRKASMKLYMGMAGQLAERLARKREVEVRRRDEFLKAHSLYVPRDVLASMGLFDSPNLCDVNIAPFDTNLLDIDISDLDRYAPEYLAGFTFKLEKPGNLKGSSTSNDSTHSTETEDISAETLEKIESDDLLDGSWMVEITGTSKLEVENAKLKADLASAQAFICSRFLDVEYPSLDNDTMDHLLKNSAQKTDEALRLKGEYVNHLESMIKMKQTQCLSYEKRIQELEDKLSNQYFQGQQQSNMEILAILSEKAGDSKPGTLSGAIHVPCQSISELMDEVSCVSNPVEQKLDLSVRQTGKAREGLDENMMDLSGIQNLQLDSSMGEQCREELHGRDKEKTKVFEHLGMSLTNSSTAESMHVPLNLEHREQEGQPGLGSKSDVDILRDLQSALVEKSKQLSETETNLKSALEEVDLLRREVETSRKLLDESQLNCAHLENCLHEAREEAQTNICAADRKTAEYNALRASSVKMHSLLNRFRTCISSSGGVANLAESLCAFSQTLSSSMNDNEDSAAVDFRKAIRSVTERVIFISRHRVELLEKYPKLEAANEQLKKELEEKQELVKTLYTKHQLEKQVNKEKISFNRLEVHEIAAFVLNPAGYYEAINRACSKYYLSTESVALFADHLRPRPNSIVGQIVHIERRTAKAAAPAHTSPGADQVDQLTSSDTGTDRLTLNSGSTQNPYGLPVGCEFFIVTIAMLPDTIHSPSS